MVEFCNQLLEPFAGQVLCHCICVIVIASDWLWGNDTICCCLADIKMAPVDMLEGGRSHLVDCYRFSAVMVNVECGGRALPVSHVCKQSAQVGSHATLDAATISASVELMATQRCFDENRARGPPMHHTPPPEMEFRIAQSLSL